MNSKVDSDHETNVYVCPYRDYLGKEAGIFLTITWHHVACGLVITRERHDQGTKCK